MVVEDQNRASSVISKQSDTTRDQWRCGLNSDGSFTVIPTATELSKRGVNLETLTCCICEEKDECPDCALVDCSFAKKVADGIWRWCNVQAGGFNKARDERVFKNNRLPPEKVIEIVKLVTFLWVKNRGKMAELAWANWSQCPFL
ncbi:unnamed protein product [Lactuca saligna]|uniref:Uncharacterized protein n=1 Tax=Lactuca saligna TaxID=75948 RepID=A0AA35Z7S2_LACSI|nr:unnamed protein product [Lactuca saligna]